VTGDIRIGGDARILEAATVTTTWRETWGRGRLREGQAEINGTAVIKGELFLLLCFARNQVLTGGLVTDYTPDIRSGGSGVFKCGRSYRSCDRFDKAPSFDGTDAGALYANWEFNQPKAVLLEDSYVNNNGILYGRPGFADEGDGEHRCIVFNGKDQYAEAPPSVADFGTLTIDLLVKRSGGGCLFDFGTGEAECFYLSIDGTSGKPTLTARHGGKSYIASASEGIPADKWVRVRVEMDGAAASIHLDGKPIARKGFAFRPRMVFIGDRPEGNFIGCRRNKDAFFKGRMDHFRIYRKVHEDFSAVGPPPHALTQVPERPRKDPKRRDFYRSLKYHTTADWDHSVAPGGEEKIPPEAKAWLLRVRGY
jgi:hypothetical protein